MTRHPARTSRFARTAHTALVLVVAAVAAACSAAGTSPDPGATASTRPAPPASARPTVAPSAAPVTGEVPAEVMDAVRAELGRLTGLDPAGATVVKAEAVEWSDGALGCPEPGMSYIQVVTPGYQVVLELEGTPYDFRVAAGGPVIRLCEGLAPAGG